MPGADVAVVIRTLNESEFLGRCLETLRRQHGARSLDLVVVDSGSTDDTVEIARAGGARVVTVSPDEFDYSRALNDGIAESQGDVVVSLSAHAIPADERWLDRMTLPFDDPRVAGVASRQVPWPDAPWQEVHRLRHQFDGRRRLYTHSDTDDIVFSNAASAIRRSAWAEHPFTLPAAEDLDWACRVLAAGWSVVYEPAAAVYHSHQESPRAQALRMIDINRVVASDNGRVSRWRGVREAAGMFMRDSKKIVTLDEPLRHKPRYLAELLRTVSYYVLDFSKAGTTAERRRAESSRR